MMERVKSEKMTNVSSGKPVPMRLFAAWEVDRTPSNCVPRLCTLTITHLSVSQPLPPGLTSVSLAARMHSSKRTLRSNEIALPPAGLLDTDLDLNFSLQYPHFVKRDGNRLQILLQRRKKYKNRTILGYKTLAEGVIRMDQVLQRSMDMELDLWSEGGAACKEKGDKGDKGDKAGATTPLARLNVQHLSSTPVDHDSKNNNTLLIADRGYSDEEEEGEFSSVEDNDEGMMPSYASNRRNRAMAYNKRDLSYTKLDRDLAYSNTDRDSYIGTKATERDSDSEFENRHSKRKVGSRGKMTQRNLKQKFVALLRRFRVPEEMEPGGARNTAALEGDREIDELFQELESLSCGEDSGPEMDTISISSTPKPSLRPFFASSRSLAHPTNEGDAWRGPRDRGMGGPDGSTLPYLDQDDGDLIREAQDHPMSGSPPKEKDEKKSRLFRSAVGSGSQGSGARKKQNSLTISTEQQQQAHDHTLQSPTNLEPRLSLLEQLSRTVVAEEQPVPECLSLVLGARGGAGAAARLAALLMPLGPALPTQTPQEVRAVMHALLNKILKHCNSSAKPMSPVRVVLVGPDALVSAALRAYVDLWSLRPPDWGAHVRFYIIPLGVNYISRYLSSIDPGYALLFSGESWPALCERASDPAHQEPQDFTNRINRYVNGIGPTLQLPIAEAMVAYRERSCDEDSSQIFVPFVNDVRIGSSESAQHSVDLEEALSAGGGSPPAASGARPSPPATPAPPPPQVEQPSAACEPLELQLDYWQVVKGSDANVRGDEPSSARRRLETHLKVGSGGGGGSTGAGGAGGANASPAPPGAARGSLKAAFRCLQAARLLPNQEPAPSFHLTYATKEKKQKIMRLGKKKEKDKDAEPGRSQTLDNVSRLICSAKTSNNVPLRVFIDGAEWNSVKFFQLSTQWQTHVKNFPISLLGAPLAPQELS